VIPPGLAGIWLDSLERWQRWAEVSWPAEPPAPRWATAADQVPISRSVRLRLYGDGAGMPVLVVTPQVNHSCIADFSEDQSLVRTLLAHGVQRVGLTDWLEPPPDHDIADSLDDIVACARHLGGRVHLVGLCQGGWQVAMVAALDPSVAASLTVAAAPIDTHADSTLLHAFVFGLPMAFFESVVAAGGGVAPGRALSMGFDVLKPFERAVADPTLLWLRAHDEDHVRRYAELRRWYRLNKGISGRLYLEVVRDLFKGNHLARGQMRVRGERVDLGRIEVPVQLVAGSRDHITPPEQVWALEALAPRAPCTRYLVDAGHIGVFMGRTSLGTAWPRIAAAMTQPRHALTPGSAPPGTRGTASG